SRSRRTGMRISPDATVLTRRADHNLYLACGGVNKPLLPRSASSNCAGGSDFRGGFELQFGQASESPRRRNRDQSPLPRLGVGVVCAGRMAGATQSNRDLWAPLFTS